jgi:hypothetical protein
LEFTLQASSVSTEAVRYLSFLPVHLVAVGLSIRRVAQTTAADSSSSSMCLSVSFHAGVVKADLLVVHPVNRMSHAAAHAGQTYAFKVAAQALPALHCCCMPAQHSLHGPLEAHRHSHRVLLPLIPNKYCSCWVHVCNSTAPAFAAQALGMALQPQHWQRYPISLLYFAAVGLLWLPRVSS